MSKYAIVARHPGLGEVTFTLEAADAKGAFARWKNVVFTPRQWTILRNECAEQRQVVSASAPVPPQASTQVPTAPYVPELDEL